MTRKWIGVAGMVAMTVAIAGAAYALTDGDRPTVQSAEKVYAGEPSLEEISKLSQGRPGEVAPPCPDEKTVVELKRAKLPVGPCDPFPERDAPFILASEAGAPEAPDRGAGFVIGFDIGPGGGSVSLPSGVGVTWLSSRQTFVRGEECISVTYRPSVGAAPVTDVLCPSSPRSSRGAVLDVPPQPGSEVQR